MNKTEEKLEKIMEAVYLHDMTIADAIKEVFNWHEAAMKKEMEKRDEIWNQHWKELIGQRRNIQKKEIKRLRKEGK